MRMANGRLVGLTAGMLAMIGGASAALGNIAYIGVQFYLANPGNYGSPATPALAANQTAGVVPQDNFNPIGLTGGAEATSGTDLALVDAGGNATPVTLSFTSDSAWWNSANSTPNEILLDGESKTSGTGNVMTYTLNNVPSGSYDLIVYILNDDASLVNANYTVGATTYYVTEQGGSGIDTGAFTQASNTNSSGPRDVGNYVEFYGISPSAGSIELSGVSPGGGNANAAVNGFQLLSAPEPASLAILAVASGALLLLRRQRRVGQ